MNDINRCPNHELLVTYLYDDCEPAERESIATHLVLCASCADEVRGLRDARVHLAAWSPPAMPLGFQLTRTEAEQPSNVLRPAAWWSRPLPAWAQAAAAVVIFAAGMSAGAMRSGDAAVESPTAVSDTVAAGTKPAMVSTVSRGDFERLEGRLRFIERAQSQLVSLRRTPGATVDEQTLLLNVGALIDERVALSERKSLAGMTDIVAALNTLRDQTSERINLIEADQQEQRRVLTRDYRVATALPVSYQGR